MVDRVLRLTRRSDKRPCGAGATKSGVETSARSGRRVGSMAGSGTTGGGETRALDFCLCHISYGGGAIAAALGTNAIGFQNFCNDALLPVVFLPFKCGVPLPPRIRIGSNVSHYSAAVLFDNVATMLKLSWFHGPQTSRR